MYLLQKLTGPDKYWQDVFWQSEVRADRCVKESIPHNQIRLDPLAINVLDRGVDLYIVMKIDRLIEQRGSDCFERDIMVVAPGLRAHPWAIGVVGADKKHVAFFRTAAEPWHSSCQAANHRDHQVGLEAPRQSPEQGKKAFGQDAFDQPYRRRHQFGWHQRLGDEF